MAVTASHRKYCRWPLDANPKDLRGRNHATTYTLRLRAADDARWIGHGCPSGARGQCALHQRQRDAELRRVNGSLTAKFKEAGLGTNQNIDYALTAQGTATWVCVNKGGANPSAQNKTTVNGPVTATGTFNSGKNGNVTASLTVQPPPSDISCPKGQTLQLASASYTGVTISDTTNDVSVSLGDFATGCLLPDVRGAC
jgi:hypothetical protein